MKRIRKISKHAFSKSVGNLAQENPLEDSKRFGSSEMNLTKPTYGNFLHPDTDIAPTTEDDEEGPQSISIVTDSELTDTSVDEVGGGFTRNYSRVYQRQNSIYVANPSNRSMLSWRNGAVGPSPNAHTSQAQRPTSPISQTLPRPSPSKKMPPKSGSLDSPKHTVESHSPPLPSFGSFQALNRNTDIPPPLPTSPPPLLDPQPKFPEINTTPYGTPESPNLPFEFSEHSSSSSFDMGGSLQDVEIHR